MKIALIGRDANRVLAFRGSLVRLTQAEGHEVIAITGPAAGDEALALTQAGVRWFAAPLDGGGLNPFADLAYRRALEIILRAERVDAVLAYNPKCLAHGPIAARRAGVRRVVGMVTGLGHGFIGSGLRERLVRGAKVRLYRAAFRACDTVLLQNVHDEAVLREAGALEPGERTRTLVIPGSGVDLRAFTPTPLPGRPCFLMVSRPLREKGLPEFFEAARRVRESNLDATFTWLGPLHDANPSCIPAETLRLWLARGEVRHEPQCTDLRPALASCSVFVLPSHREGTSKVMLEAMASGRCVITTDAPGCGEVIEHDVSGLVAPCGSVQGLAEAMSRVAGDAALRARMGAAARVRAERVYDSRIVDRIVLDALSSG